MKKLIVFILFCHTLSAQETNENIDIFRNKGYFNITRFSFTKVNFVEQDIFIPGQGNFVGKLSDDKAKAFALETINGYFFSPYFSLGVGFGLDGYHNPNINTMPLFLDSRVYLKNGYNSLFAFMDLGLLAKVSDNFTKGSMFNIGAGYKFSLGEKKRIFLLPELSYSIKSISLTDEGIKDSDNIVRVRGLRFGLGILF